MNRIEHKSIFTMNQPFLLNRSYTSRWTCGKPYSLLGSLVCTCPFYLVSDMDVRLVPFGVTMEVDLVSLLSPHSLLNKHHVQGGHQLRQYIQPPSSLFTFIVKI